MTQFYTHTHTDAILYLATCGFILWHMEEICPLANTFISRGSLDETCANSDNHLWPIRTNWSVNLLWKMAVSNENVKWTLTFCNQSRWIHLFTKPHHVKQALIFHQEKKKKQTYSRLWLEAHSSSSSERNLMAFKLWFWMLLNYFQNLGRASLTNRIYSFSNGNIFQVSCNMEM